MIKKAFKLAIIVFFSIFILFPVNSLKAANTSEIIAGPAQKIRVLYFYAYDCPKCESIKPFLANIKETYKNKIDFIEHDVKEKEECRQLFYKFIETYGLGENPKVPLIFVGNDYLSGADDIQKNLEPKINEKITAKEDLRLDCHKFLDDWAKGIHDTDIPDLGSCSVTGSEDFCSIEKPDDTKPKNDIVKNISLGLIISTAIIDSINPCAIAVLLFLLSVLLVLKADKKRIIIVGLFYIFAVFITYYAAGIGILSLMAHNLFLTIASPFMLIFGALTIIGGFISIREGLLPQATQLLVIPEKTKSLFLKYLEKGTIPGVLIAGVIVSLVELPCTGQVYLSILSLMSQEGLKTQAHLYLLLYNFIFVLPLVIILFAAAWGLDINRLQDLRKDTRKTIKILIGLIMIILGIWLAKIGINL